MRYIKFVCKNDKCRSRSGRTPRPFYRANREGARTTLDVKVIGTCPACKGMLHCSRIQKSAPKNGLELGSASARRYDPGRERRRSVRDAERKKRQALVDKRRGLVSSSSRVDDEDSDPSWAPPPQFKPSMRLTKATGGRRQCRSVVLYFSSKVVARRRITASTGRVWRSTNQNAVMGAAIVGSGRTLSAWAHSGRPDYTLDRYVSSEWCHLVGDCLGGPTTVDNLVAASFAANTEMMAIEHALMGKTHLFVQVTARCLAEHVAERIVYTVSCKKGHTWTRQIDGKNDCFTRDDLADLKEDLGDWLSTHKRC